MTNPLITPEDLLYITDFENDSNFVRISVDTHFRSIEIHATPKIVLEWANNRGKLDVYYLDNESEPRHLDDYMANSFGDSECLDLARFCVQYYPETIKSII